MSFSELILCCIFAFLAWSRYNDASRGKPQEERNEDTEKSMLELSRKVSEGFEEMRNYIAALHYSGELKPPLEYQLLDSKIDRLRYDWAVDRAETCQNHGQPPPPCAPARSSADNASNHDSPKHDSPKHYSYEHDSPNDTSPNDVSPSYDTSNPDSTNIEDDDDRIEEYLRNIAREPPAATADNKNNPPTAEEHRLDSKEVVGGVQDNNAENSPPKKDGGEVIREMVLDTTRGCDLAGEEASSAAAEDSEAIAEDTYCTSEGSTTLIEESPVTAKSIDAISENLVTLSVYPDPPIVDIPASTQYDELSEEDDDAISVEFQTEESEAEPMAMEISRQSVEDPTTPEHTSSTSMMAFSKGAEENTSAAFEVQDEEQSQTMRTTVAVSNEPAETAIETRGQNAHGPVDPTPEQGLSAPAQQRCHVHFSSPTQRHDDVQATITTSNVEQQFVTPQTDEPNLERHVEQSVGQPSEYQASKQPLEQPSEQPVEYQPISYLPAKYQQTKQTAQYVPPADYSHLHSISSEPAVVMQDAASLNNVEMSDAPDLGIEELCQAPEQSTYQHQYQPPPRIAQQPPVEEYVYIPTPQACTQSLPAQQQAIIYQESAPPLQHSDFTHTAQQATVCRPTTQACEPSIEPSSIDVTPTEHHTPDVAVGAGITNVSVPKDVSAAPDIDEAVVATLMAVVQSYDTMVVGTRLTDLGDYMETYMDAAELIGDLYDVERDIKSGTITTQEQLEQKLEEHLKGIEQLEADHEATLAKEAGEAQEAYDQWLSENPLYAEALEIYERYGKDFGERIDKAGERQNYGPIKMALVSQQIQKPEDMRAKLEEHWQNVLRYETPAEEVVTPVVTRGAVVVEDEVNSQRSEYFAEILGKRKPASKGGPIKRCWHEYEWNVVLDDFYEPEAEFHQGIGKDNGDHVELDDIQPGTDLADIMKDCVVSMNMD